MAESNTPIKIGGQVMQLLKPSDAGKIVKSIMAMAPGAAAPVGPVAEIAVKPGVERWDVKTGNDADERDVGQNTVDDRYGRWILRCCTRSDGGFAVERN